MNKLLIVLLSDDSNHENMARALHALLYAKQAEEAGMETKLIFDGGGTVWASKFAKGKHFKPLYEALIQKGVVEGVCSFCAGAFKVEDELKQLESTFLNEDSGHPNIGKRAAEGWQIITL